MLTSGPASSAALPLLDKIKSSRLFRGVVAWYSRTQKWTLWPREAKGDVDLERRDGKLAASLRYLPTSSQPPPCSRTKTNAR